MNKRINIGRTIARERRRRDITQEALADHLGVSKAAVSKWELGQSLPDVSLLPCIAAYFSLTLDELCRLARRAYGRGIRRALRRSLRAGRTRPCRSAQASASAR